MKKKLFVSIVSAICAAVCAFGLAACGGHDHDYQEKYSYNSEYHWRQCTRCKDKLDYSKHSADNDTECGVCGYKFKQDSTGDDDDQKTEPPGPSGPSEPIVPDTGDDSFKNISVSTNGVLSWNKIKGASKYVLKITYASESDQTEYTVDKTKTSANLNELRTEGFPSGKSSVEIVAYEKVEVNINGQEYQEVPMTDVKQSFRIVKSNGSFSLVKLSYADANIKLDGFYAEKQTIDDRSVYLYEQILKDNNPMTLKINNIVKAAYGRTVKFYKTEEGRNSDDPDAVWNSFELQMGYPQVRHGANFYYVKAIENDTGSTQDYDLCVYGLYTLTVKRLNVSFTETNGLRDYTNTPIGNDLKYTEMDIVPQDVLYDGVENGKLARTANYKTVEKEDLTIVADSTDVTYYFYDEATVRADCQAYAEWSKTYYLSEYPQGWRLSCNYDKASGMVNLPNIIIGKKVISASFEYSDISALVVENGAETFTATFADCWKLLDIFLPDSITTMQKNSFKGVNSNVVVHCAFDASTASNFPLYWDYDVNKRVSTEFGIAVPENALTISNGLVFSECENNGELAVASAFSSFDGVIPDVLTFNGKTYKITQIVSVGNVENLTLGKNINHIADGALVNVKDIAIANDNAYYTVDNGILYSKDHTSVIFIADKSILELIIDDRVQNIAFGLLSDFYNLQSLTVPFIGATSNGTENTHFGYIFGASTYSENSSFVPSALLTVTVTSGTKVDDYAFYGCNYIVGVTLPQTVEVIGDSAFYSCAALSDFTIPDAIAQLGENAFRYCNRLRRVDVKDLSTWCNINFKNEYANPLSSGSKLYVDDQEVTDFSAAENLTSISAYAFCGYYGFTSVVVPDTVTRIGLSAFGNYRLDAISVPFIGESESSAENNYFLYIFGATDKEDLSYMPRQLTSVTVTNTKYIDDYAFHLLYEITEIILPDDITDIGNYAFNGCNNLSSIFIPNSVTSIGANAFANCDNITSVTIPAKVVSIGQNAFKGCDLLSTVNWNATACDRDAMSNVFENCPQLTTIVIGDNVTVVPARAFSYSRSINNVTIGNSVNVIGQGAFWGCTALSDITIPNGVTVIGENAFYNTGWFNNQPNGLVYAGKVAYSYKGEMPSDTSITIVDGTKGIGNKAFVNCIGLTRITIPESVISIGEDTFYGCSGLTSVTIPNNVTSIGRGVFYNCSGLTSITIPNGVTSIGDSAFSGCSSLASIEIPNSVTSIGYAAFSWCSSLTSVTIPNNVTSIDGYVFDSCSSLTSVNIPNGVTTIGVRAFGYCDGLTSFRFNGTKAQWNAIKKANDWEAWDDGTGDYTVHCTDGDIAK